MAAVKKKTTTNKKISLKKSKKVNPWMIGIGALLVAIVGAVVIRYSFAGTAGWPEFNNLNSSCGATTFSRESWNLVLTSGKRGPCVKLLQEGLYGAGFLAGKTNVDGVYGTSTGGSVLLLETFYKVRTPDRVADVCTWATIQGARLYGKSDIGRVQNHVRNVTSARCF